MSKRIYKITEEQYSRLLEYDNQNNGTETVIQTTRDNLADAASKASATNASKIEITDAGRTDECVLTKKQLVSEARKKWKKGTKVVKLSDLLKK